MASSLEKTSSACGARPLFTRASPYANWRDGSFPSSGSCPSSSAAFPYSRVLSQAIASMRFTPASVGFAARARASGAVALSNCRALK